MLKNETTLMWKRSQCEVNASCTSTAFPQSLVLSGPIIALDPPSYEAGLGHTQGWEEALKTVGFHPEARQYYSFGGSTREFPDPFFPKSVFF